MDEVRNDRYFFYVTISLSKADFHQTATFNFVDTAVAARGGGAGWLGDKRRWGCGGGYLRDRKEEIRCFAHELHF